MNLVRELQSIIRGEVLGDEETLTAYSTDASIFVVRPRVVVYPQNTHDVRALVRFVREHKKDDSSLALTARSAGTDMSGGPLGESIIVDFTKHMNRLYGIEGNIATVEPGMYYRDFEKETLKKGLILPSFTASKSINAVGGMVGNNSAGELSLVYGQTQKYIEQLKVVLSDGKEYTIKRMEKDALDQKIAQDNFEGEVYRKMYHLIDGEYGAIQNARPHVSKNAAGYYLWNVWDKTHFDLNQVIVGSQGTLGIITEISFRLVPVYKHSRLLVIFLYDIGRLSRVVNAVLECKPESFESYDKNTLKIAFRFLPGLIRQMGAKNLLKLGISFIPDVWILAKGLLTKGSLPELVLLAEFSGDREEQILDEVGRAKNALRPMGLTTRVARSEEDANKYWTIRRQSFALLRKHVGEKRTAPFIDDVIVEPQKMSEFLPRLNNLVKKYPALSYTIAGHAGNGNFHIIPLMDFRKKENRQIIPTLSEEVYDLVLQYGGSITAEHNDGLIRSPYLKKMYGENIYRLFEKTKYIFDPQNIFNPGKKVGSSITYALNHITKE